MKDEIRVVIHVVNHMTYGPRWVWQSAHSAASGPWPGEISILVPSLRIPPFSSGSQPHGDTLVAGYCLVAVVTVESALGP